MVRLLPSKAAALEDEAADAQDEAVAASEGKSPEKQNNKSGAEKTKTMKGFRNQEALGKVIQEATLTGDALSAPEIGFKAPDTGFYHIVWKAGLTRTGPVVAISHPSAVLDKRGFSASTLYFYVPKGTQRFFVKIPDGSFAIKDGRGNVILSCASLADGEATSGKGTGQKKTKRVARDTSHVAKAPAKGTEEKGNIATISGGGVMVDVPPGSDGAIWSFEAKPTGGMIRYVSFIGVSLPSYRPDLLLVPKDALNQTTKGAR